MSARRRVLLDAVQSRQGLKRAQEDLEEAAMYDARPDRLQGNDPNVLVSPRLCPPNAHRASAAAPGAPGRAALSRGTAEICLGVSLPTYHHDALDQRAGPSHAVSR